MFAGVISAAAAHRQAKSHVLTLDVARPVGPKAIEKINIVAAVISYRRTVLLPQLPKLGDLDPHSWANPFRHPALATGSGEKREWGRAHFSSRDWPSLAAQIRRPGRKGIRARRLRLSRPIPLGAQQFSDDNPRMPDFPPCFCCAWCCPEPCSTSQSGDGCGRLWFCVERQTFTEAEWIEAFRADRFALVSGDRDHASLDDELVMLRRFREGECLQHPEEQCGCVDATWTTADPFGAKEEAWT